MSCYWPPLWCTVSGPNLNVLLLAICTVTGHYYNVLLLAIIIMYSYWPQYYNVLLSATIIMYCYWPPLTVTGHNIIMCSYWSQLYCTVTCHNCCPILVSSHTIVAPPAVPQFHRVVQNFPPKSLNPWKYCGGVWDMIGGIGQSHLRVHSLHVNWQYSTLTEIIFA